MRKNGEIKTQFEKLQDKIGIKFSDESFDTSFYPFIICE